jgi:hypothetical protein
LDKRLYIAPQDIEMFERIKLKINVKKDVEVIRSLMRFYIIGDWIKEILDDLKREIITTLLNQDTHQGLFLKYLSL